MYHADMLLGFDQFYKPLTLVNSKSLTIIGNIWLQVLIISLAKS